MQICAWHSDTCACVCGNNRSTWIQHKKKFFTNTNVPIKHVLMQNWHYLWSVNVKQNRPKIIGFSYEMFPLLFGTHLGILYSMIANKQIAVCFQSIDGQWLNRHSNPQTDENQIKSNSECQIGLCKISHFNKRNLQVQRALSIANRRR